MRNGSSAERRESSVRGPAGLTVAHWNSASREVRHRADLTEPCMYWGCAPRLRSRPHTGTCRSRKCWCSAGYKEGWWSIRRHPHKSSHRPSSGNQASIYTEDMKHNEKHKAGGSLDHECRKCKTQFSQLKKQIIEVLCSEQGGYEHLNIWVLSLHITYYTSWPCYKSSALKCHFGFICNNRQYIADSTPLTFKKQVSNENLASNIYDAIKAMI